MDIFQLRQQIIKQYEDYTSSFLTILDSEIDEHVRNALRDGRLWPDALIQLSPAYDQAATVADLVKQQTLHPLCGDIFARKNSEGPPQPLHLYRHQKQAIDLAADGRHFVVTTGTGSGKSLTYLVPIVNHILNHRPEDGKVRAIIVYPMNALINSQAKAIDQFFANLPDGCPVRFDRYTGQEKDARKREIQQNPPHILLTNYVMLELMLTRPNEFTFVDAGAADLRFVVLDELHTYRGRQGADVALLLRRLRERSGNPHLICIGTSATMISGDTPGDRRTAVAGVASTIFGVTLGPDQVIEETLTYATQQHVSYTPSQLRAAVEQDLPVAIDWSSFRQHPLAHWIEQLFSLRADHTGTLRRAEPRTLLQGAQALAQATGAEIGRCHEQLRRFFDLGSEVSSPEGKPGFTFKLHQFISQGSAVYSTLESAGAGRHLTLEGQRFVQGPQGDRLLFPLVFCRECGQHYALCALDPETRALAPRQPLSRGEDVAAPARAGYVLIEDQDIWREDLEEHLPDSWFNISRRGRNPKKEFREYVPQRLEVYPDGRTQTLPGDGSTTAWFLPTPFLTCLRCGAVYTKRDRDDFRKLARLSSEGRSTATTLIAVAAIDEMRRSKLEAEAQKLLSFTDNRQDASLQAGHFNDFANVALLRSAVAAAIAGQPEGQPLNHLHVAQAVLRALDLPQDTYARGVGAYGGAKRRNEETLAAYLEYRIYEDLRRSWRITQPNLEQCGLLRIDYLDLHDVCADETPWQIHPILRACGPAQRERAIRAMLEHMRRDLAIDAPCLDRDGQGELIRRVLGALKEPWCFASKEQRELRAATRFVVPGDEPVPSAWRSFSIRSQLGRFLRSPRAWPALSAPLDDGAYEQLLGALLDVLVGTGILVDVAESSPRAVQIRRDALLWCPGDGSPPPLDLIRTRRMEGLAEMPRRPNSFFQRFYRQPPASLRGIEGREHTGQVDQGDRETREDRFGRGQLPVLFCSPTMELGIDIRDLNVVHMRNVPPTPANYAQRSGRAGRSGQPALVMTYCSTGSGHDQYFFQRQPAMVAGAVAAPQIELANEDLVRAHIQAIWLGASGLNLGRSMLDLLDAGAEDLPLKPEVADQIALDSPRQAACMDMCRRVLASSAATLARTSWYGEGWLAEAVASAPREFDRACRRWRELYQTADEQLLEARRAIDAFHRGALDREKRAEAERHETEAKRQKDLLCNTPPSSGGGGASRSDSDFHPYRYFASEGFLPGYNFPRLPVRAFLAGEHNEGAFLARPRFLALTEFGPQNIVYHEGQKFRITRAIIPAGDAQRRLLRAKICRVCGYFHEGVQAQICEQCGTQLSTQGGQVLRNLFEMTTMSTRPAERITCEEEERVRTGFRVSSHYQFARVAGALRRIDAETSGLNGFGLRLSYGPTATIWRINHGWLSARLEEGFALDLSSGKWESRPGDDDQEDPLSGEGVRRGIRIVVRDTRNLLVLLPDPAVSANESAIASLQYALQRGIAAVFQLEEQELSSALLGDGPRRRIVYWEAAEGGAGVLRRLVEEPDALARAARAALEICHADPASGAENAMHAGECRRACYRCLLSYGNQPVHELLDRRLIRDQLLALARADVAMLNAGPAAAPRTAPTPSLALPPAAARVLAYLQASGRPPDRLLDQIAGQTVHLAYTAALVCLLCPEPGEPTAAAKVALEDQGYTVVVIRPDQDVASQLARYLFWRA